MLNNDTTNKIQDIISGTYIDWQTDTCTATRNFLCGSYLPSTTVKKDFENNSKVKKEQEIALVKYVNDINLWMETPPETDRFLTEGVKQKFI